jgi:hypothetical protein
MDGMGKLNYNEAFEELIGIEDKWCKYEGEFREGVITGFGNLFLSEGEAIVGYFLVGLPQYYTKAETSFVTGL